SGNTAFNTWLGKSTEINDPYIAKVGEVAWPEIFSVESDSDNFYTLYGSKLYRLEDGVKWRASAPKISEDLFAKLPSTFTSLSSPSFVKGKSSATVYLVSDGVKRKLHATSHISKLKKEYGAKSATVYTLSDAAIKAIKTGNLVIPSGLIIQEKTA